jgi:hypothetical protein
MFYRWRKSVKKNGKKAIIAPKTLKPSQILMEM